MAAVTNIRGRTLPPAPVPAHLPAPAYEQDGSPDEVESRAELIARIGDGGLAGLTVQGVRLDVEPTIDVSDADVTDTLFVGCRFAATSAVIDLVRRGAHVIPEFEELPFGIQPPRLYTPDDLVDGFADGGFDTMFDTRVYRHFLAHGGVHADTRTGLAQRLHDAGIDNALAKTMAARHDGGNSGPVVGVMGGHAEPRGSAAYRLAADLGRRLSAAGALVVTGGGPGVMEAVNLGAYLAGAGADTLPSAIDTLADAPEFTDHDRYTLAAQTVRERWPAMRTGGLAVPTWLYGHEPTNLFAAAIAKYFSNAVREDMILDLCRGGVVFTPGRAGTVQEIFQAVTKVFYAIDGVAGPLIFLGRRFWTEELPVRALLRPLLATAPSGDLNRAVHLIDDPAEAVPLLTQPGCGADVRAR